VPENGESVLELY